MTHTLESWLIEDEGVRLKPYTCTAGKLTIGVGRNLTDRGISLREAQVLFQNDIRDAREGIRVFLGETWGRLNAARKDALTNMAFALGLNGFMLFRRMVEALRAGNWEQASLEILDSKVAREDTAPPYRWRRIAEAVRTGEHPPKEG